MMPARRGLRGKQGFPGTPGARGATGPQGPSGSGTSASGFPGYRQRAARRPQFTPWVDKNAGNVWSGPQTFNVPQFGAALILGNTAGIPILFTVPDNTAGFTLRATGNTHGCGFSLQTNTNTDLGWLGLGDWALAGAAVNDVTLNCATGTLRLTVGGTPRFVLTQAGNISLNAPSGGNVILQLNGTGMLSVGTSGASYNTPTGTTHTLRINAVELITFNGAATTGAFAATFAAANKPGLATSPSVGRWLPVMFGGTQFYIPMWQ